MRELIIGAGNKRQKVLQKDSDETWHDVTTLDIDPDCNPNILHNLNDLPLPFDDNLFDEIHAYEVLEHIGQQGDWKAFFGLFNELHRILKPEGYLYATCPRYDSLWAWSDPGHTRVITHGTLGFLDQDHYKEVGKTPMTDYRHTYSGNFKTKYADYDEHTFYFALERQ